MDSSRAARVGALLFAMFAIGWLAVISRDPSALASEMWPAGLAAAAVFTARGREVPVVLALVAGLSFATFALGGRPTSMAVGAAVGVVLEAWLIAAILTDRGRIMPRLRDDADVARFVVAIGVGGGVAALASAVGVGGNDPSALGLVALGTFVGHVSSALFLLPFFLERHHHGATGSQAERVIQWLSTAAITVAVFVPDHFTAMLFLVMPFLAWGARRLTLGEVQLQLVLVATIGTFMTVFGLGPLAEAPDAYALPADTTGILLQSFLLACGLVATPLAVVVGRQIHDARQLRVERDKVQRIVDSASVVIIGTDQIGRITLFNPGASRVLGYTPEEVTGRFATMFHSPEEIGRLAKELGVANSFLDVSLRLTDPDVGPVDIKYLLADGTERMHSMTLSAVVDDRGQVTGYVSTSEDVTDRVRAHEALTEALATERRAVERLREVDHVKDSFVSAVSHELRTPITSIVGYLELLQDGGFGELAAPQARAVHRINANSQRLLLLIDELLTLSRVQDDGLGMEDRELDLRAVVRTAYDVVAPAWLTRRLDVTLDLPDDPVLLTGDVDMLERVVVNLLSNAVKFTPEDGRVSVSLDTDGGDPVIAVSDTGIGIPTDELELLFTRFFRSSNAQARAIPGSGLGLSIARAIVEMHGGEIEVVSAADLGTTFRVRLPVER